MSMFVEGIESDANALFEVLYAGKQHDGWRGHKPQRLGPTFVAGY